MREVITVLLRAILLTTLVFLANLVIFSQNGVSSTAAKEKDVYPLMPKGIMQSILKSIDGKEFTLDSYNGKVVLINLWAIWCSPCRPQITQLVAIQNQYKDHGLEVMGLDVGDVDGKPERISKIKRFAKTLKIRYLLVRSDRTLTNLFYLISRQEVVPQSFIIDRDGRLRGVFAGGGPRVDKIMKSTIDEVMKE